ncbi:MAG: hypothetical protein KTR31_01640 [Myxococcales bacterium]|nr:hypothetical protein [Myxococcales bacterium]
MSADNPFSSGSARPEPESVRQIVRDARLPQLGSLLGIAMWAFLLTVLVLGEAEGGTLPEDEVPLFAIALAPVAWVVVLLCGAQLWLTRRATRTERLELGPLVRGEVQLWGSCCVLLLAWGSLVVWMALRV